MGLSRRSFLKLGAVAAGVLVVGGTVYRLTRHTGPAPAFDMHGDARQVMDAIVAAVLDGTLPTDATRAAAIASTTEGVRQAILGLPRGAQKELQDLFGLLALGPARRFLAGVPDDWPQASTAQVAAFLQGWRVHRIKSLRPAYSALHDLVLGAWYSQPAHWASIGYPGPIKELS